MLTKKKNKQNVKNTFFSELKQWVRRHPFWVLAVFSSFLLTISTATVLGVLGGLSTSIEITSISGGSVDYPYFGSFENSNIKHIASTNGSITNRAITDINTRTITFARQVSSGVSNKNNVRLNYWNYAAIFSDSQTDTEEIYVSLMIFTDTNSNQTTYYVANLKENVSPLQAITDEKVYQIISWVSLTVNFQSYF